MKQNRTWTTVLTGGALVLASPALLPAQSSESWNDDRVLELVQRARAVRQSVAVDTAFRSYQSEARGYVYFFVDRPDTDGRTLVKVDQIAVDVFWQAPNTTRQRIVGLRDEKVLPTNIRYHLDHLTVVQDDFGNFIRMGGGDEVEEVLHPVGPESEGTYDFLLTDSITIRYAGGAEEVRVYEVRVRPRDFDRPGFVGTVYLDRATAAIVRMNFSFTPSSYVDPYLDYIRISLDNSLWMERYWLPYRQEVEIRRELPLLDFMAGSVILGRFETGRYDFNVEIPGDLLAGQGVTAVSPTQREAFPFERGLFDDLEQEGLVPSPSMEEVRAQVRQVVRDRALSGLAPLRLHLASTSDVARYNRAEGLRVGAGLAFRPEGDLVVRTSAGYAIGRRRMSGSITATGGTGRVQPTLDLYWDELGDVGGYPGASTLLNTISAVSGDRDFTDPFFRKGATLTLQGPEPTGFSVLFRWEEHRSALDVVSDDPGNGKFRPVLPVEEGALGAVAVSAPVTLPGGGHAKVTGELGRLESRTFASLNGEARWEIRDPERPWHAEVSVAGGALTAQAPVQSLYLLGGRWTLPGHDYRSFAGDRYWLLRGEGTIPVRPPYLGVRLIGALGSTYLGGRQLPSDWIVQDSGGIRASIGAGLSFAWDTFRLDFAHGLRGGGFEVIFSVAQQFRAWL